MQRPARPRPALAACLVDQRSPLRASMPQKRIRLAPQAELQALFAENAVKSLFDDAALLLQQCLAK